MNSASPMQHLVRSTRPVAAAAAIELTLGLLPALGLRPEDVGLDRPREMPWGEFIRVLERISPHIHDVGQLEEVIAESFRSPSMRTLHALVRWSPNPAGVARALAKVAGAQAFPAVSTHIEVLDGNEFRLWIHVPEPLPTHQAFFQLSLAGNRTSFLAIDPNAQIEMVQVDSRTAFYEVHPSRPSLRVRFQRWLQSFRSRDAALDLLEQKNQEIRARLSEVDKARREAQLAREAAEDALQVRNAFLRRISHELRTPAHQVLALVELARLEEDPAERAMLLETADASGRHLTRMIDGLLDLTQLDGEAFKLSPERVSVADLLDGIGARFLNLMSVQGRLLQVEVDGPVHAHTDPHRLEQVVDALVENALTHGEGTLSVTAAIHGGHCVIDVDDCGPGPAAIPQLGLFEVGDDRSTRAKDGLGLGLTLVPRLLNAMGGDLEFLDNAAGGTRARIRVPAAPPEA